MLHKTSAALVKYFEIRVCTFRLLIAFEAVTISIKFCVKEKSWKKEEKRKKTHHFCWTPASVATSDNYTITVNVKIVEVLEMRPSMALSAKHEFVLLIIN